MSRRPALIESHVIRVCVCFNAAWLCARAGLIADDPGSRYDWYNPGDTLTVVFSEATNLAGLPASGLDKAAIDSVLAFSETIGADYAGPFVMALCQCRESTS